MLVSLATARNWKKLLAGVAIACLAGVALLILTVLGLSYRASNPVVAISECGDGELLDKGAISYYPRYVLELPPFDFAPGTSQTFHLNCLPSADLVMWLVLDMVDDRAPLDDAASRKMLSELAEARLTAEYTLSAAGSPLDKEVHHYVGELGSEWRRAWLGDLFFFAENGQGAGLGSLPSQGEVIGLDLTIHIAGGATSPPVGLRLQPQLVGGGFIK